jgi:hypothetical protein
MPKSSLPGLACLPGRVFPSRYLLIFLSSWASAIASVASPFARGPPRSLLVPRDGSGSASWDIPIVVTSLTAGPIGVPLPGPEGPRSRPRAIEAARQAALVIRDARRFAFSVLVSRSTYTRAGMAFLWNGVVPPSEAKSHSSRSLEEGCRLVFLAAGRCGSATSVLRAGGNRVEMVFSPGPCDSPGWN